MADGRGPLVSELNRLMQEGDLRSVVDCKIDYTKVDDVEDVRAFRSIQALISKQDEDWFGYGVDATKSALDTFMKAERRCKETNIKLDNSRPHGAVSVVSHLASRKISWILGDVPPLASLPFSYGPGASTNVRSAVASHRAKLSASPMCSEDMLPFVGEFLAEFPYLAEHHCVKDSSYFPLYSADPDELRMYVSVQVGNGKLTFVPKSVKTKRPIVVEPVLNGLAQKGIGNYIKERLLRMCNLDLRDQKRNREAAYRGSVDGSLATIDLSCASDTVSISAIFELLPHDWVAFLGRYRTGSVDYGIQSIELQKWSSMGNAYTFELESLLFFSLACACCEYLGVSSEVVSVFGDDIIVPTEVHTLLFEVLDWYGFWVNDDKSYTSGPFRESCGADWFRGCDVRPFYLKERMSDQTLYSFHNWAMRNGERKLAACIQEWTIPHNRLFGPDGYGDGHLIGDYRIRSNRKFRRCGYGGGFFDTYTLNPKRYQKRYEGDWLYPTYSVYVRSGAESESDPFVIRGHDGYAKTSIYTLASTIFCG
jgi:hypothetical protein